MSTKLMNQGANPAEGKSGSTSGSWQKDGTPAPQNPPAGNKKGAKAIPTAEVMADLLARLMDIQASWQGADSMVMAEQGVLLVALPLYGSGVGKIIDGHGREIYTVNGAPVVMAESESE